jgi:hypothetical protein
VATAVPAASTGMEEQDYSVDWNTDFPVCAQKAKYVFSVSLIYRISLTPRFGAVHARLFSTTALAVFFFPTENR